VINEVVFDKKSGTRKSRFATIQLVFHGFDEIENIKVNGRLVEINTLRLNFQKAAEDPLANDYYTMQCPSLTFKNSEEQIIIHW
jgi:hypothetical protein